MRNEIDMQQRKAMVIADELCTEFPHYEPILEAAAELRRLHNLVGSLSYALQGLVDYDDAGMLLTKSIIDDAKKVLAAVGDWNE